MKAQTERTYRIANVCIDDPEDGFIIPPTQAYIVANDRWNGWVIPYFAKEQADAVIAAWNANAAKSTDDMKDSDIFYDAKHDQYHVSFGEQIEMYEGEDIEIDGETRRLYGIGACGWTWDLEPKAENEPCPHCGETRTKEHIARCAQLKPEDR